MNKLLLPCLIGSMFVAAYAQAEGDVVEMEARSSQNSADYWTPERLKAAKPYPLPSAAEPSAAETLDSLAVDDERISKSGRGPTVNVKPSNEKLFEPDPLPKAAAQTDVDPQSVGTDGAYFSSSRVLPAPTTQNAYPYRAAGKLFFTGADGKSYICSASVIRHRMIVTAGHCVYDAKLKKFHSNFRFVPAYHNGSAPFGTWGYSYVITTSAWASGGGGVPNAGDFAIIEATDNASAQRIGSVTGYYGYSTNSLYPNHVKMLGYPGAFDAGGWMHEVNSESFRTRSPNCVEYGSDMPGGSSGGPWLMNFGQLATGQTVSPSGATNRVVGVTSYGPVDLARRYQGASILNTTFTNTSGTGILDKACAHKAGNCS